MSRPDYITDDHLEFLDGLRESGVTNMLAATPYLVDAFDMDRESAGKTLGYWMDSFGKEDR